MRRPLLILALVSAAAVPAPALATAPKELFDAPGQSHAGACAPLAVSPAPLEFADGSPTGFDVTNGSSFDDGSCPDGWVRLDNHELLPSPRGALVFHRGGNGYVDDRNTKYGELATADLTGTLPAPVPSSGGRGAACTLAGGPAYRAEVRGIPSAMHYKRPQDVLSGSNAGASFEHYGDPGADQGTRRDVHYSYLLWSFLDVRGGGMVRTLIAPDQVVEPCDVQPLTLTSWDRSGAVNGSVTARYVRVLAGACPVYGWMVWQHTYASEAPVEHAAALPGAAPPAPGPSPDCPNATPASAPITVTGDAATASDGSATLAGSVNPVGVDSGYRFDYGPGTGYGASTPPAIVLGTGRAVPVKVPIAAPSSGFPLHYRLVAWSVHGTTFGKDRTLPLPTGVIHAGAGAPRPGVSALRVAPGRFRRARARKGAPAAIRYRLSQKARLTLGFQRRVVGVRRAGACRAAGHRSVRRAARCARWVTVRGSLRAPAASAGKVRFGGWIGRRKLARGSYRVRATPAGGRPRLARFSLR